MAWDELDLVRVHGEFLTLAGADVWDRVEDAVWQRRKYGLARWIKHGQWWRKTTIGKKVVKAKALQRAARLKQTVVAVVGCKGCGKPMPRTAYQREHGRGYVCSPRCRGLVRDIKKYRIGGESRTLSEWAARYQIGLTTVCKRRRLGWSLLKALRTPVRQVTPRAAR